MALHARRAAMAVLAVALVVLAHSCGARTGLDGPPPCAFDADCAEGAAFCGRVPVCRDGFCALGEVRDCRDASACTVDACDEAARACTHVVRDRDGDGWADGSCGGDDCDDADPAVHPGAPERCEGGRDEDCDGRADCSDSGCASAPACATCRPEACTGGADEDCDARVDCGDSDCVGDRACCTAAEVDCDDARDEDCDGPADCLDPDCALAPTCCEPRPETCDGTDEDCDGVADDGATCYFLDGERIAPVTTSACGAAWYSYDEPVRASASTSPDVRRSGEVAVAVQVGPAACGGANVAVVADMVRDGSGGALAGFFVASPAGAGGVVVSDDGGECRADRAASAVSCDWEWQPCCTDGVLLGPFASDFCLTATLSRPSGVDAIVVVDGSSGTRARRFDEPFTICGRTAPAVP